MRARFAKKPPANLYLSSVTFVFDPLDQCRPSIDKGTVDRRLATQLHELGEARYPLRLEPPHPALLRIPWAFKSAGEFFATEPASPYRMVAFSRVAFNANRTEAYFAYSDSCGGLCGNGGAAVARRKDGKTWTFGGADCIWVY